MTTSLNRGVIPELSMSLRCLLARQYRGIDQTELAELVGSSRRVVSRIETGAKRPTRGELIAWSYATGVDLHWLETGEAPSPDGDGASSECAIRDSNPEPAGSIPCTKLPGAQGAYIFERAAVEQLAAAKGTQC